MYEPAYNSEIGAVTWFIMIAVYLYFGYAQYKIAQKTGHSSPWWSFIPILNVVQWVQMANKPMWWFLFCLVPIVNVIVMAILWMEIAKAVNKPPFWGILMLLPFIGFIAIGVLGFSGSGPSPQRVSPTPQPDKYPEKVS